MTVRIRASNFQSICDADVEVDHFTVVTGQNNSGKTALQRSIRGVFQNTSGTAFIREGTQTCTVLVDFGADGKVEWSKGLGKRDRPTYRVNDGEPLYPGSSVPEEVEAFGVVPIMAGGQEVWPTIAPQFTGQIFLLDRPGSALAEAVADVERVGQLNRALRKSEGDKRQATAALKVRRGDLTQHEARVAAFEGLDDALEAVGALGSQQKKVQAVHRAVETLTEMRSRLVEAEAVVSELAPVKDIKTPDADQVCELLEELTGLIELRRKWTSARAAERKFEGVQHLLVDVSEKAPTRLRAGLGVLRGFKERLSEAEAGVVLQQQRLEEAQRELIEATALADEALSELGACPVCGTETEGDA